MKNISTLGMLLCLNTTAIPNILKRVLCAPLLVYGHGNCQEGVCQQNGNLLPDARRYDDVYNEVGVDQSDSLPVFYSRKLMASILITENQKALEDLGEIVLAIGETDSAAIAEGWLSYIRELIDKKVEVSYAQQGIINAQKKKLEEFKVYLQRVNEGCGKLAEKSHAQEILIEIRDVLAKFDLVIEQKIDSVTNAQQKPDERLISQLQKLQQIAMRLFAKGWEIAQKAEAQKNATELQMVKDEMEKFEEPYGKIKDSIILFKLMRKSYSEQMNEWKSIVAMSNFTDEERRDALAELTSKMRKEEI